MRDAWRGLAIALLAIPANAFFLAGNWQWWQSHPTTISLYYNVVGPMFVLVLLNKALKALVGRRALRPPDLLFLYAALTTASALSDHDWLRPIASLIPHAFWFSDAANMWRERICPYLPQFALLSHRETLRGFYDVGENFWQAKYLLPWLRPIGFWALFTLLLVGGMLCLSVVLRREWTERIRMAYPVVEVPRLLILKPSSMVRSKVFWAGFAVALVADTFNGLHFWNPIWPSFGGGRLFNIGPLFTERPWNAIGWTPIALYPFAVGLAYFIPLELSFSCWFFYLVFKWQKIVAAMMGYTPTELHFPYTREQGLAAFLVIAALSVWVSRGTFKAAFLSLLRLRLRGEEPVAALFLLISFGGLLAIGRAIGLPWWANFLAFTVYFGISIAVSRIRAELGSPVHDLHFTGPDEMFPRFFGVNAFSKRALGGLTMFFAFNRAHRGHPMPNQLEAFKLAQEGKIAPKVVVWAVLLGATYGFVWGFLMFLHVSYRYAGNTGFGWEPYSRFDRWLIQGSGPNLPSIVAFFLGGAFTYFLYLMLTRFPWWPFHPVGYAVAGSWSINVFWLSIFMAWLCKFGILRYGGLRVHREISPFFAGLIVGEFLMGTFWAILGNALHRGMYNFLP